MNNEGLLDSEDITAALATLKQAYDKAKSTWRDDEIVVKLLEEQLNYADTLQVIMNAVEGGEANVNLRRVIEDTIAPSFVVWHRDLGVNPETFAFLIGMMMERAETVDARRILTTTLEIGLVLGARRPSQSGDVTQVADFEKHSVDTDALHHTEDFEFNAEEMIRYAGVCMPNPDNSSDELINESTKRHYAEIDACRECLWHCFNDADEAGFLEQLGLTGSALFGYEMGYRMAMTRYRR